MNLQSTFLFVYPPLNFLKWPVYQPAYSSKHYHVDKRTGGWIRMLLCMLVYMLAFFLFRDFIA